MVIRVRVNGVVYIGFRLMGIGCVGLMGIGFVGKAYWIWVRVMSYRVMGLLMGNGSGIGLEVGKNTRERNERRRKIA